MLHKNIFIIIAFSLVGLFFFSCSQSALMSDDTAESTDMSLLNSSVEVEDSLLASQMTEEQKNLKRVEEFIKNLEMENVSALKSHFSDDIVLFDLYEASDSPESGYFYDKDDVSDFFIDLFDKIEIETAEKLYDIKDNNRISYHVNLKGMALDSEIRFDLDFVYLFEFCEKNEITQIRIYYDSYNYSLLFDENTDPDTVITDLPTNTIEFIEDFQFDAYELNQLVYDYFYWTPSFEGFMGLLSEEIEYYHNGPVGTEQLPYYEDWFGKDEVVTWLINLISLVTTRVDETEIEIFVAEGNRVDVFSYETYNWIHNPAKRVDHHGLHSWQYDENGKIKVAIIFPDGKGVYDSYFDSIE